MPSAKKDERNRNFFECYKKKFQNVHSTKQRGDELEKNIEKECM